ncbi:hypothetical protein D8674_008155 [Pyrus ussuriensis x Pyrus communis]|uniref:Retrovirus-related Pol polyprotein from transposon TNT 1-94 n=1 Tax=Pyrus ussuriensis x Pyrus communis TaxID=2448454 RepID=A0A5N5HS11_9ROSA|nr:hypothetical protein D8674_008155 [Pyrus ussuriensis x Pyrus communis]
MTRDHMFHKKTKHIGRRYHYIREVLQSNIIKLIYCHFEDQLADIFTKVLPKDRLYTLREKLGVKLATSLEGSVGA